MSNIIKEYNAVKLILESKREVISDKKINKLERLVLNIEDKRFFYHPGFDILSIIRVCYKRFLLNRVNAGGASTIEQQLVRTITNDRRKNILRKIKEILLASLISLQYEKLFLLRVYLCIAYYGTSLDGLKEASNVFNKTENNLNYIESAFIASMLKYPKPRKTNKKWINKVEKRANYSLLISGIRKKKTKLKIPN